MINSLGGWSGQQISQPSVHTGYDLLGRVSLVTAPDGTQTTSSYSDGGESLEQGAPYTQRCVSDANAQTTCTLTDLLGRVRRVSPPLGPQVVYSYDVEDQLVVATYGGASTLLSYDLGGRKLGMDDPDLGSWSYAYDALGNLTRQADARGQRVCLYYDALNRLRGKHYRLDDACPTSPPVSLDVAYLYDGYDPQAGQYGIGYRTGMVDDSGSTSWRYDTRGRMTQESKAVSGSGTFTSGWTYNSADLVSGVKYANDNLGNLSYPLSLSYHPQLSVNSLGGTSGYVKSTSYDAAGRVVVRRLGGGPVLLSQYQYSPWSVQGGRLEKLKAGTPANPTNLLDFSYSYDPVGNILAILDSKAGGAQTQSFEYDDLDRLTSATASGGTQGLYSESYTYAEATGNLSSKGGITYAYDPEHPHAVASTSNGNSYQYDANGNQIQRIIGGVTTTLEYDEENRLKAVKQGTTTLAEFVYDGDGVRVKGTVGGVTTTYIGNYLEWTGSISTMKRYYYAGGIRVAMRVGSTLYYLLGDHLGSTSVAATSSGGLQSKVLYKAWGEDRYTSGMLPTGHRYTGQYSYMAELGLYYYGARWYDPGIMRFTSPDTLIPELYNPLDWNRYSYARYNPVRYTDPTGHMVDDGCNTQGCTGNPNATIHIIYMGGFPPVPAPNSSSLGSRAEDSYDPGGKPDPSGLLGMINDAFEQGLHYKYQHDPKTIHAFLKYEENSDGSMNITSVDIWNRSNVNVSVGSVDITASHNPCTTECLTGPSYNYLASPPRIGSLKAGLGVIAPNSYRPISLIPSGSKNPANSFYHNYTINVAAVFNAYFPGYNNTAFFRMLQTEISW